MSLYIGAIAVVNKLRPFVSDAWALDRRQAVSGILYEALAGVLAVNVGLMETHVSIVLTIIDW